MSTYIVRVKDERGNETIHRGVKSVIEAIDNHYIETGLTPNEPHSFETETMNVTNGMPNCPSYEQELTGKRQNLNN